MKDYKSFLMVATAFVAVVGFSPVAAETSQHLVVVAQAAAHEPYSCDSPLGTLLDDPQAKAVLQKIIPTIVNGEQIEMARGMTLRQLQQYSPNQLSNETLAKIDAELAKLNTPKS